jgi:hypothetical protein
MSESFKDRRDPNRPDRRELPRGGRREGDLPHPITCPNCGKIQDVRGLANSRAIRWCHCTACGEVWPWSMDL